MWANYCDIGKLLCVYAREWVLFSNNPKIGVICLVLWNLFGASPLNPITKSIRI